MIDLKIVIRDHPGCMESRAKLRALLRDIYPEERRSANLVLDTFESGVVHQIKSLSKIDSMRMNAFVRQLIDEYGLQEIYAIEGIKLWAQAFSIPIEYPSFDSPKSHIIPNSHASSQHIEFDGSSTDYEICSLNDGTIEIVKFRGFEDLAMVVPNKIDGKTVSGIGVDAYKGCSTMEELVIPEGITYIRGGAFSGCRKLRKITLPNSLVRLGYDENGRIDYSDGVFSECVHLEKVDFPNSVTTIPRHCFKSCFSLVEVTLPDNLIEIEYEAFQDCSSLAKIGFPGRLKTVGYRSFVGCKSLMELYFNEGLEEISSFAFVGCSALSKVLFPRSLNKFGNNVFIDIVEIQPKDKRRKSYEELTQIENLTIYCYAGSKGLEFARLTGYPIANATTLL